MKYVKLNDGILEYAPKNKGSILNYNLNVDLMLQDGYKPFVEVERPETIRFYHIEYLESSDDISEVIVYDETQEEAEERVRKAEEERVKMLSCTKRDFALMLQELGVTYSQLKTLIASNEQAQLEWDLCERLYRFNPLLDEMAERLGITPLQLDMIFKTANGENTVEELRALK